jgi:hypothetical protein
MVYLTNPCYTPEGQTAGPGYCIGTNNVKYTGSNLPNTGIDTNDNVTVALQKIDADLDPTVLAQAILTAIGNSVQLKTALCNLLSECP